MNGSAQQLPLQGSERAPFHGDPAMDSALELAAVSATPARIGTRAPLDSGRAQDGRRRNDGEFVVVNLEESSPAPQVRGAKGEGSDLKKLKLKYGSVGDDVELGPKTEGKHVSNASKDDAADGDTVCRVCHLGLNSGNSESIELGCACKQDLALCHRDCAEEWFKIRGNIVCEICGETAKNVHIPEPLESTAAHLEANGGEPNTHREFASATVMTRLRYFWANQLVRNSLLASMIVVFMVPWFFRIAYF